VHAGRSLIYTADLSAAELRRPRPDAAMQPLRVAPHSYASSQRWGGAPSTPRTPRSPGSRSPSPTRDARSGCEMGTVISAHGDCSPALHTPPHRLAIELAPSGATAASYAVLDRSAYDSGALATQLASPRGGVAPPAAACAAASPSAAAPTRAVSWGRTESHASTADVQKHGATHGGAALRVLVGLHEAAAVPRMVASLMHLTGTLVVEFASGSAAVLRALAQNTEVCPLSASFLERIDRRCING
jgi:hypothetical protein